jgi:hypothetical protein
MGREEKIRQGSVKKEGGRRVRGKSGMGEGLQGELWETRQRRRDRGKGRREREREGEERDKTGVK